MAQPRVNTDIKESGHKSDKNEDPLEGVKTRMDGHDHRLNRLEDHVGLSPMTGVAAEETGKSHSKMPSREPNRGRARH